jgi:prolyl-tRNA synthetase
VGSILSANPGSLGPVHDKDIRIFADNYVRDLNNLVVGANEDGLAPNKLTISS